jgi:hypothetical protein
MTILFSLLLWKCIHTLERSPVDSLVGSGAGIIMLIYRLKKP